jgi:hypothetical protein
MDGRCNEAPFAAPAVTHRLLLASRGIARGPSRSLQEDPLVPRVYAKVYRSNGARLAALPQVGPDRQSPTTSHRGRWSPAVLTGVDNVSRNHR